MANPDDARGTNAAGSGKTPVWGALKVGQGYYDMTVEGGDMAYRYWIWTARGPWDSAPPFRLPSPNCRTTDDRRAHARLHSLVYMVSRRRRSPGQGVGG
jgi:hypothetical protein